MADPVTTPYTAVRLTSEVMHRANELYRSITTRELKASVEALIDNLHELKQLAIKLEDENRDLREKLRFNHANYSFDGAFYYRKDDVSHQPLCPACHVDLKDAPMSEPFRSGVAGRRLRECLKCKRVIDIPGTDQIDPEFVSDES